VIELKADFGSERCNALAVSGAGFERFLNTDLDQLLRRHGKEMRPVGMRKKPD